jgi:hypothetical protein
LLATADAAPGKVNDDVTAVPFASSVEDRTRYPWDEVLGSGEGWAKDNRYYWMWDYRGFLEIFFSQMFTEPHSTK